jgi:hypothetical protein
MKPFFFPATLIFFSTALAGAAFSPSLSAQSQSDPAKAAPQSSTAAPAQTPAPPAADQDKQDKAKKKPKKVWTNDELSTVSGGISVVGDSSKSSNAATSRKAPSSDSNGGASAKDQQIASYRDQLQQLRAQLDATDKKINDTRNFKADNTSASGGINMNKGYSMTPIEDQVKQLEAQKKQIQEKIDALEDEARKNGIEPGQLR